MAGYIQERSGMEPLEKIRQAGFLWVYGAGIVGKRVLQCLDSPQMSVKVFGVAVTQAGSGAGELAGHRLYSVEEIDTPPEKSLFIIAVASRYQGEIVETLRAHGYDNYVLWDGELQNRIWELCRYTFIDRRKHLAKVCFVLGGYKDFLWNDVFGRLERFVPEDVEVCILSSGKWDERLADLAERQGWSYLATSLNSVTLIQNMAVRLFSQAEWIYKLDEDMFLTEGCFEKVMGAYLFAQAEMRYEIGLAAPLIPLNGYGYVRLLERLGMISEYDERFERALCGGNCKRKIECDDEAAAFMWGLTGAIPQLDELSRLLGREKGKYSLCNVRFSIGFILYRRSFWENFGGFDVSGGVDLGGDEDKMGKSCMNDSYAIVVAEDIAVGHFSFGKQTGHMRRLYEANRKWFAIAGGEG